ncbi:MAG TPA: glycosyl transferase family protein [Sneathiellales bacterium]|nr:glycosyl transferase family protein [Sneathiellales bacterium]
MVAEHSFAQYVRLLGRGQKKSRSLTEGEAYAAQGMILRGEVESLQLGAFLMLLRVKEETPEEIAGFTRAVRDSLSLPNPIPQVDLDWSTYAGKRRQLPWFLLSALLLAQNGVRIFMQGTEGHTPGRIYTRATLESLGIPTATSFGQAAEHLATHSFAYLPLENLCPMLHQIIAYRPLLGLRSPAHTVGRMINPLRAPYLLQGIFHVGYLSTHQQAARLLGQSHMAVFRGEGGEIERNPSKPVKVRSVHEGVLSEEIWPALLDDPRHPTDEEMDVTRLQAVWRGEQTDEYATAAITGTIALALKLMGRADTQEQALATASEMWNARPAAILTG